MAILKNPYVGDDPPDDFTDADIDAPACPHCGATWPNECEERCSSRQESDTEGATP